MTKNSPVQLFELIPGCSDASSRRALCLAQAFHPLCSSLLRLRLPLSVIWSCTLFKIHSQRCRHYINHWEKARLCTSFSEGLHAGLIQLPVKPRAHNSAEAEFVLIMMLKMPWGRAGTAGPMLVISHPEAVAICSGHSVSGEGKKKGGGWWKTHGMEYCYWLFAWPHWQVSWCSWRVFCFSEMMPSTVFLFQD